MISGRIDVATAVRVARGVRGVKLDELRDVGQLRWCRRKASTVALRLERADSEDTATSCSPISGHFRLPSDLAQA